jgi:hypothetical protein
VYNVHFCNLHFLEHQMTLFILNMILFQAALLKPKVSPSLSRCVIARLVPSGQKNEREKVVVAKGPRAIAIIMKRGSQIGENRTKRKRLEIIFSTTRLLFVRQPKWGHFLQWGSSQRSTAQ